MQIDLSERVVLVTGASRGIGLAIAKHLAEAGARVGAHFNRRSEPVETLVRSYPGRVAPVQADLADLDHVERIIDDVVERFGQLDILVNNAGIAHPIPLDASPAVWQREWEATMRVNLGAAELLCRLAIRHFQARGGGRIINIASRAAFRGDTPEYMSYAASKGGLVALTRSIARGFGKDGIRAFVVAPGFVRTDMAQAFMDTYGEEYALRELATARLTEPDDIAPTVVFLASGLADHATGSTIDVNAASYVR